MRVGDTVELISTENSGKSGQNRQLDILLPGYTDEDFFDTLRCMGIDIGSVGRVSYIPEYNDSSVSVEFKIIHKKIRVTLEIPKSNLKVVT